MDSKGWFCVLLVLVSLAEDTAAQSVTSATLQAPSKFTPGGSALVTIEATVSGLPSGVSLIAVFQGGTAWGTAALAQTSITTVSRTVKKVVLSASIKAPVMEALFKDQTWVLSRSDSGSLTGSTTLTTALEVTCSDGIYCNGVERLVRGNCVTGTLMPCKDPGGDPCVSYTCDEANQRCGRSPIGGNSCQVCLADACKPSCKAKLCGDDGCGGSCGTCSVVGDFCVDGSCSVVTQLGTCARPEPLFSTYEAVPSAGIVTTIYGDNRYGLDMTKPVCQAPGIKEYVYKFTISGPTNMGMEIRMLGADGSNALDTLLAVHDSNCQPFELSPADNLCSDDQTPPGNLASRVYGMLPPGTYTLIATGYATTTLGPYRLDVTFIPDCVPKCEGKYCGPDGCGQQCGPSCPFGTTCNAITAQCQAAGACTPDCKSKKCGADGCGGSCGTCKQGQVCDLQLGTCTPVKSCDYLKPVCQGTGSQNQFCGSDCQWHGLNEPMPDLVPNTAEEVYPTIYFQNLEFPSTSCAALEGCVSGYGKRLLMRFDTRVHNVGTATFYGPDIVKNPQLFEWGACHQHYHFQNFARFKLFTNNGTLVLPGAKLSYCMEDSEQYGNGTTIPCTTQFNCDKQGIPRMRTDLYAGSLDCQWLDITDLPKGCWMVMETCTNIGRTIFEMTYDNNCVRFPVYIPANYPTDVNLNYNQAVASEGASSFYPGCKKKSG